MRQNCLFVKKRVKKDSLTYNGEVLMTYTIEYPAMVSFRNRLCLKKINEYYQKRALAFQKHCEEELYPMAIQQYKDDRKNSFPIRVFDAVMKYTVTDSQACIVSLYIDQYEYTGGAHGNTVRDSQTWNLKTCQRIELVQLISCLPDPKSYIMKEVAAQIEREPDIYFEDAKKLSSEAFQEESFYCKPKGIVVYYQQYDIAPYSSGIREFLLPYQDCVMNPIKLCK